VTSDIAVLERPTEPNATRSTWPQIRVLLGVAVIALLVVRLGAGPFLDGIRLTRAWPLLAATLITAATTACCAWRWRLVAHALGVRLDARASFAAVYRAQFLNATLPGGVLGDVDRAVGQAGDSGPIGPGVRAVVWERTLGQVVQVALTIAVVLALPSPLREAGRVVAAVAAVAIVSVLAIWVLGGRARPVRVAASDVRAFVVAPRAAVVASAVSAAAVAGHVLVLLLAARVAGVQVPMTELVPLAMIVLLGASVPANIAGWGPREGVAAWAFGALGLGVTTGVTTAVVYGVMALVATLPGALVLLAGRIPWRPSVPTRIVVLEEAARG